MRSWWWATVAFVVACGSDAAQTGSATSTTTATTGGGAGGDDTPGDGGGGQGGNLPPSLRIEGPPDGLATPTRTAEITTVLSTSRAGELSLVKSGAAVHRLDVEPGAEQTLRLRLPLDLGSNAYEVRFVAADGATATDGRTVYGGARTTGNLSFLAALRDGQAHCLGGGTPEPKVLTVDQVRSLSAYGNGNALYIVDSAGDVHRTSDCVTIESAAVPAPVFTVAVGGAHRLYLAADGTVWAEGLNAEGQLGLGDLDDRDTPQALPLTGVIAVAATSDASFAVLDDGSVMSWGANDEGQLGVGEEDDAPHPTPATVPLVRGALAIDAGRDHVVVLATAGKLWSWGGGASGQLGDGGSGFLGSEAQAVAVQLAVPAAAVAAGGNTSYAIALSGELYGWGQNSLAQLGVGDTNQHPLPTACVVGSSGSIGAGAVGATALSNGRLYVWGTNAGGQLGDLPPVGPERSSTPIEKAWP